jgi:uncharacterized repeat protein (TIGR01451 family)
VVVGNQVDYTINVTNSGPENATNVDLTVTLPGQLLSSTAPGTCTGSTILSCPIGALAAGQTQTITVSVTPASGPRKMALQTLATSDQVDRNPANDGATATTTVQAEPGTLYVAVRDSGFGPAVLNAFRGAAVKWNVFGPSSHGIHDGSGLGVFADLGPVAPVAALGPVTFSSAGTYPIDDTSSANTSTVSVPVGATPTSGTAATNFTIKWAAAAPTGTLVFDVQHRGPGGAWQPFRTGVTAIQGVWNPTGRTKLGNHGFRARTRDTAIPDASTGWSAIRVVNLHS